MTDLVDEWIKSVRLRGRSRTNVEKHKDEYVADEIDRLTKQWNAAVRYAEDKDEYVLAQVNQGLKAEIERLNAILNKDKG